LKILASVLFYEITEKVSENTEINGAFIVFLNTCFLCFFKHKWFSFRDGHLLM